MPDLVEIAKGVTTPESRCITANPSDIKVVYSMPPLFDDSRKQRIGTDLVQLAKQHGEWVAVSASSLFGENGIAHFSNAITGMCSDGYVVLYGDKSGLMISPTQELADFYMAQQHQE
ncbi:MAG: hypothetical protein Q8R04_02860 [Nanoarchaeota archaeon]|nr:hypothetical protein [Nanoarchaeota archaeon]